MVLHNREHASRLVLNVAQDSQFVTE
jgi:hypothetical protein